MKNLAIVCLALIVAGGMVATVSAGEHVSKSTLNSLGLSSMKTISDNDGLAIRGKGFFSYSSVSVSGTATAKVPGGTTATNGYSAHGSSYATGSSLSYAATVSGGVSPFGFIVSGAVSVAGGSASAFAH